MVFSNDKMYKMNKTTFKLKKKKKKKQKQTNKQTDRQKNAFLFFEEKSSFGLIHRLLFY